MLKFTGIISNLTVFTSRGSKKVSVNLHMNRLGVSTNLSMHVLVTNLSIDFLVTSKEDEELLQDLEESSRELVPFTLTLEKFSK